MGEPKKGEPRGFIGTTVRGRCHRGCGKVARRTKQGRERRTFASTSRRSTRRGRSSTIETALDLVVFRKELVDGVRAMRRANLLNLFEEGD
jgi:hypothetical protein